MKACVMNSLKVPPRGVLRKVVGVMMDDDKLWHREKGGFMGIIENRSIFFVQVGICDFG